MDLRTAPGRHYVLVVDGEPYRARATLWELRTRGCYVASASTGAEALKYVIENEPDAVVADWNLSDMSGPGLARRVKSACFATKVFLQKEAPDVQALRQTLESGGEDLLPRHTALTSMLRTLERSQGQLTETPASAGAR